jgi:hypothetical protein
LGVCSSRSGMSAQQRMQLVQEMVSSERAQLAANVARPRGVRARAMLRPVRSGNGRLVFTEGILGALMGKHNAGPSPFCAML